MEKCICKKIFGREVIYIHLLGCPESSYSKEYNNKKWYQKLFYTNPRDLIL